jgi:hypothetical protein
MYMYFCPHTTESVYLYSYKPPNRYKSRSGEDLMAVDTSITIAVAIGMTIDTIFLSSVGLDI